MAKTWTKLESQIWELDTCFTDSDKRLDFDSVYMT